MTRIKIASWNVNSVRARIDMDRAYVRAVRNAEVLSDPRIGPSARDGWEWVADVHDGQVDGLAQRSELGASPG